MKIKSITSALLLSSIALSACADEAKAVPKTIFKNVSIFNGTDNKLIKGCNVVIEKNKITNACSKSVKAAKGDTVIDGKGRTLMPGLIDAHVHLNLQMVANPAGIDGISNMTWEEVGALAYESAQEYLYSGFTTVRDLCGSHDGMRKHIMSGELTGPRIYLSGACISQTSGHGDFRDRNDAGFSPRNVMCDNSVHKSAYDRIYQNCSDINISLGMAQNSPCWSSPPSMTLRPAECARNGPSLQGYQTGSQVLSWGAGT